MLSRTKEEYTRFFKDSGHRMTRQRGLVFEYLSESEGYHPSARNVFESLAAKDGSISVATVYNTLGSLVQLGLIKIIEFESGDNRYELNLEPHINLICSSCGGIEDLQIGPSIHTRCAREHLGFHVRDFRLEYYGLCSRCAGENGGPSLTAQ
jgi:Fe2+ or Zn2+ uptake regulation protein